MKYFTIIFIYLFSFTYSFAIDANIAIEKRNSSFVLEEIIELQDILLDVKKNNSLKFRGNNQTFFSKFADGIVAIFTDGSTGSGVIINEEGLVVTNWHVIQGFDTVSVVFKPPVGTKAVPTAIHKADVIMVDETRDLALLKPIYPPKDITYIKFPNDYEFSDDYLVSQEAHCIGHPEGYRWTYTKGIVSQIRTQEQWSYFTDKINSGVSLSDTEYEQELEKSIWHVADVLQIDCSINPGNSGGPIMNFKGELLGINSNFVEGSQTLNFAIALHEVQSFLEGDIFEPVSVKQMEQVVAENIVLDSIDFNEDGIVDTLSLDFDGNLIADTYYVDDDYDLSTGFQDGYDYVLLDSDENDIPEARIYWEGSISYEEFDIEQDGIFDILMVDYNEDGEYDLVQKI